MSNTLGRLLRVTTFGESHGPQIGCVVDGCPAGLHLSEEVIQPQLDRRKPGTSRYTSQRREADQVQIVSGVFQGITTGAPIALMIANTEQRSRDYDKLAEVYRPGHADYTYQQKYGHRDHRGGGRASARDTANWVAAGAIARHYLREHHGVELQGYLAQMGEIVCQPKDLSQIDANPFFCPDSEQLDRLAAYVDQLRRDGDSVGAAIQVRATGVPTGLGEPIFGKLDAAIAHAMMTINAVKAVAIGDGFDCARQQGSQFNDQLSPDGFSSNHAGGILGGISTGQDLVVNLQVKPTSSIRLPQQSLNHAGQSVQVETTGRHDPCVGIRAVPVAEAMLALVLMDLCLLSKCTAI